MLVYNKLANKYLILDVPNKRSSHTVATIRGGGIIFVFSFLISGAFYPAYWLPVLAVFIIGIVSFLDDQIDLSKKLRILFQTLTMTFLFYYLNLFSQFSIPVILWLYILSVGIINAFNFMDGINGITGLYSLVLFSGLQYINLYQTRFIEPDLIWFPMMSCLAFLFFNFRKNARCFPGDVGSITIGFWVVFLLLKLILQTGDWIYILFLTVYGVDTILTIIQRIYLGENIFLAHRRHFFQIMANEKKIPHLAVATIYAFLQLIIICYVLFLPQTFSTAFLTTTIPLTTTYITLKIKWRKLQ
jgi:UDP-N-acetylmuramyl pentapeptide phosphotransferase/UDP-N-acetylglucosamine-1-phosphate transferase